MYEYSDFQNNAMSIGDCRIVATASTAVAVNNCDEQKGNATQHVDWHLLH